jgi:hypothetical protein
VVDLDARGDVGGAAGDSPRRRWRLWYFNNDGRCLGKISYGRLGSDVCRLAR